MEVVIAMVIIVLVFGIAMIIFSNVLRLSLSEKKIHASAVLREAVLKAENNPANASQTFIVGDFKIVQEAGPYNGNTDLTDLHLTIYDQNNQKIDELQQVMINNP